ncbi:N-acetylneuraminate synthase [Planctomycetes bacterium Poly30]|uniref:N-acetylneuraminate synthase n=1 Tax=Saltatorellus ferox TaxID=2528018 RepID=UPI0011A38967
MSAPSTSPRTLIIAEAGVNHNGSLDLARQLIERAAEAGADYVKFQTFIAEKVISASAPKAAYQKANAGDPAETQLEMVKKLELSAADHRALVQHAALHGIRFASTAFDSQSFDLLGELGVDFMKVPSGEVTNLPFLRRIASARLPIIMSTGMCDLEEIGAALGALETAGARRDSITLLHCNTQYPTPIEDVNLRAMATLREAFGVPVGYSDHTLGIEVPIAAVALGATVIEKHFTLDSTLEGPDHSASLEPDELTAMVRGIRRIELALGGSEKRATPSEIDNRAIARRSLVARVPIREGEELTEANLGAKRPGTGVSPMRWDEAIGRRAGRSYGIDEPIDASDLP